LNAMLTAALRTSTAKLLLGTAGSTISNSITTNRFWMSFNLWKIGLTPFTLLRNQAKR
jgi:hypothetical protein